MFLPLNAAAARHKLGGEKRIAKIHQDQFSFAVEDFKAVKDDMPASFVENPGYIKYTAPLFKSVATIKCRVPTSKSVTVGFIQQVNSTDERQDYTKAFTTWEQPSLPVGDFEGNMPPWSGTQHERITLKGSTAEQTIEVSTNDQPFMSIGWREPLPPDASNEGPQTDLQKVERKEHFTTGLVARDNDSNRLTGLKKISWTYRIIIDVDPTQPLGLRARLRKIPFEPPTVETPGDADDDRFVVPPKSLAAPSANQADQLWWNPKPGTDGKRARLL